MTEHLQSHFDDETVRISREAIDAIDQRDKMKPEEVRVLLPESVGQEQTFFKIGETPLSDDQDADLFTFRINENGEWVLEGSNTEDSWTIPRDVEFSLGSNGVYIRLYGEADEPRPVGLGKLPLVAQRLVAGAVKEQEVTGNAPKVVLLSHPSENGEGTLLSIKNTGDTALPLETHHIEPKDDGEALPEDISTTENVGISNDNSEQAIVDEPSEAAPAPVFEATQVDEDEQLLVDRKEKTYEDSEDQQAEESASVEPDKPAKPAVPRKPLSISARLEGLDEDLERDSATDEEKEFSFSLDSLTVREAIDTTTEYVTSRFDTMSSTGREVVDHLKRTLPQALRIGHMPVESGVFDALDSMKRVFVGQGEEIGGMAAKVREYVESERDIFASPQEPSEERDARRAVVDTMEKLADCLENMEEANADTLNVHRILDDQLHTIQGPYYPDVPQYDGLAEAINDSIRKLADPLETKAHEGREVRTLLEELSELRSRL